MDNFHFYQENGFSLVETVKDPFFSFKYNLVVLVFLGPNPSADLSFPTYQWYIGWVVYDGTEYFYFFTSRDRTVHPYNGCTSVNFYFNNVRRQSIES